MNREQVSEPLRAATHLAIRKLIVLDSSFSFEAIRSRGLEYSVTCRDLEGFFEHVWTVHPFATLVTSETWTNKYGKPEWHSLDNAHTFIDGKVGRFEVLRRLPRLNFLISQCCLFFSLVRLVRIQKIDVIRTSDPLYLGLLGWALSRFCGIPFLVRVGANYDKAYETTGRPALPRLFLNRRIEKKVEKFVFTRADLVAGANQDNLDFALANGARFERSTLFPYGNLIDRRHFIDPSNRDNGQLLLNEIGVEPYRFLLYIGRLESIKHPDDVVRVLAEIRRRGHNLKMILVGDGQLRFSLVNLTRELGVSDQVVFCGNMNQQWLAQVIPLASVVVSPITGRALSEAALGAAPIVAYDMDWQGDLIRTGVTGELVPARSWIEMADAVEKFLKAPIYARAMGDAVRKLALEMLDPAKLNQHERDQYEKLLTRFARDRRRWLRSTNPEPATSADTKKGLAR